jgi:hypothetical protein
LHEDVADSLFISFTDDKSVMIGETLVDLSDEAIKPGCAKYISLLIPNILFSPGNYSITIVFSKSSAKSPKGKFIAQYRSIANFGVIGPKRITAAPLMLVSKKVTINDC